MRTILHILTKSEDALALNIIERQRGVADTKIEVVDLTKPVDYDALVERIFAVDSIEVF